MSRAAVYAALRNSLELQSLGVHSSSVYAANSVDTPINELPIVVMRWEETTRSFGDRGTQLLTIWAHDNPGDYTRIDSILESIKFTLGSMVHVLGEDGRILTQIDWQGDSGDLYDDGFETITKNSSFLVVSRAQ